MVRYMSDTIKWNKSEVLPELAKLWRLSGGEVDGTTPVNLSCAKIRA